MISLSLSISLSRFLFPVDKTDDELEMTMVCHRPEGLEQLEAQTNFTKQELQILYRGFKNVTQTLILDYFGTGVILLFQKLSTAIYSQVKK